jgi:hypothetical protein
MILINGVKISDSVHKKFKEDFPVYEQILGEEEEEEEDNDICLPQIIHHQAVLFNLVISKDQIEFLTSLLVKRSPIYVFQLTEPLDYLMSEKNMAVVVKTIAGMIQYNPNLTPWIENMEDLSSLEKLSLENIHKKYTTPTYRSTVSAWDISDGKYRFSDNVWILIKIALFKYKVVRTFGLSHMSLFCLDALTLSEKPQCILDELVRLKTMVYPTTISGRLYDDNSFDLGNCCVTYKNGNSFHGSVILDKDIGCLRHGDNGSFYSENILEHSGRYVYDVYENGCDSNREDVVCFCDLCHCRRRGQSMFSEDEEEDEEEEDGEEKTDDQSCFSRENYNHYLNLVTSRYKDYPFRIRHCKLCSVHMNQDLTHLRIRKVRYWDKILDLNLTESQIFNKRLFDTITTSRIDPLSDIFVKSVDNYQDYIQYVEPSPKILEERAQYFNEKREAMIETINNNYYYYS